MRRLLDEPEIADLETRYGADGSREALRRDDPAFDAAARAVFGLTHFEAHLAIADLEPTEENLLTASMAYAVSEWEQVAYFRSKGWDVTDSIGRPAHVLKHFVAPLAAALCGLGKPLEGKDLGRWDTGMTKDAEAWARTRRLHDART